MHNDWQSLARCADPDVDPILFFPGKGSSYGMDEAKAICAECVVCSECLEYAIWSGEKFGIWGGTSELGRRKIRRERRAAGMPVAIRESYRAAEYHEAGPLYKRLIPG